MFSPNTDMKSSLIRILVVVAGLLVSGASVSVRADELAGVKSRMEQRLSQVDQLKTQGVIGENNRGLLELRGGNVDAGDVVAAENRDRGMVYAEIAKKTRTSVDQVARHRARQIASSSAAGVWLQKDDGSWFKK